MCISACVLVRATTARVLRVFESADRSSARPANRRPAPPATASSGDMGSFLGKTFASSSDELDVESGEGYESAYGKLKTKGAGDRMVSELERMDQLLSDLTAERDRIKRESGTECHTDVSMIRFAEFLRQANNHMTEAYNVLSSGCLNPGRINQLPLECIAHVMHFIPIQQVFVCMSVNKKWQEAARFTVKKHKRMFGVFTV